MEKKYILTDESINYKGKTLYRIKALKDFEDVKKGDFGGFIESYNNLSQEGNCWIGETSKVYDNAKVIKDAIVDCFSKVYGNALISDNSKVITGTIYDNAKILDFSEITSSRIHNNVEIYDKANIWESQILGNVKIGGKTTTSESKIYGNAKVKLKKRDTISGNICLNADITKVSHIYLPSHRCHKHGEITFFKNINNDICISLKWFKGTINVFMDVIKHLKLESYTIYEYSQVIEEAKYHMSI